MRDDRHDDFWETMYLAENQTTGAGGSGLPYGKIFLIGGVCIFLLAILLRVEIPFSVVEIYIDIALVVGFFWLLKWLK